VNLDAEVSRISCWKELLPKLRVWRILLVVEGKDMVPPIRFFRRARSFKAGKSVKTQELISPEIEKRVRSS
jgi:hypothetical protein